MILITRPCVEALRDNGPVETNKVTMWKIKGRWRDTEIKNVQ